MYNQNQNPPQGQYSQYGQQQGQQQNQPQGQYGQPPMAGSQGQTAYCQQHQFGQQPPHGQQQPPYGQQQPPYGQQQPPYGQQQPPYGQQQPPYGQQQPFPGANNSKVQVLSRGNGINDKEFQDITSSCIEVQDKRIMPMSGMCVKKIKEKIRGEWYVFVCPESEKNYDFYLSFVDGGKYLTFKYGANEFHVCGISV